MSKSSFIPTVRPTTDFSPWNSPGIWQVNNLTPLISVGLQYYGEVRETGRGTPKRNTYYGGKEFLTLQDRDAFDLEALSYRATRLLKNLADGEVPLTRQTLRKARILKVGNGNNINASWLCYHSYWVHYYDKLYQRGISRGDALFILSDLDSLLIVGEQDPYLPDLLTWLYESKHVSDSLPMIPLIMRQGRFQEWNPVPSHSAWAIYKKIRLHEYHRAYEKQRALAQKIEPSLAMGKAYISDNPLQQCLFTVVPGSLRGDISLPYVDAVVFDLEDGSRGIMPVSELYQQWPEGIENSNYKPPRFLLKGIPPLHVLDKHIK